MRTRAGDRELKKAMPRPPGGLNVPFILRCQRKGTSGDSRLVDEKSPFHEHRSHKSSRTSERLAPLISPWLNLDSARRPG